MPYVLTSRTEGNVMDGAIGADGALEFFPLVWCQYFVEPEEVQTDFLNDKVLDTLGIQIRGPSRRREKKLNPSLLNKLNESKLNGEPVTTETSLSTSGSISPPFSSLHRR